MSKLTYSAAVLIALGILSSRLAALFYTDAHKHGLQQESLFFVLSFILLFAGCAMLATGLVAWFRAKR